MSTPKKNRAVFWGVNVLLLGWLLRGWIAPLPLAVFAAGMALALYVTVIRWNWSDGPACMALPQLMFFDLLLCVAVPWAATGKFFSLELMEELLEYTELPLLLVALCVAALTSMLDRRFRWVGRLGGLASGVFLAMVLWGTDRGVRLVGGAYALLACLWYFFTAASERSASARRTDQLITRNDWLGRLLFLLYVVVSVAGVPYLQEVIDPWEEALRLLPGGLLSWWQALLWLLILFFAGAALYHSKDDASGADVYVCGALAGGTALALLLQTCSTPLRWPLLAAYGGMVCVPMGTFTRGKTCFRQDRAGYLVGLTAAFAALAVMVQYSLWINLIVSIAAGTALYHLTGPKGATKRGGLLWAAVLLTVCGECAGLLAAFRFQTENFAVLVLITGMALAVLAILSTAHPGGWKPENWQRGAICAAAAVLCVVLVSRHGSRIDVAFDMVDFRVSVATEARGEDNGIVSAQYCWSSLLGDKRGEWADLPNSGLLDIGGDKLIVAVVDQYGVETTRTAIHPWS